MKSTLRNGLFLTISFGLLLSIALLYWIMPWRSFSPMENRLLKAPPEFSLASLRSGRLMDDTQSYLADQIIGRDLWVLGSAAMDRAFFRVERNEIVFGHAHRFLESTAFWNTDLLRENLSIIDEMAAQTGCKTSLMLIPTSAAAYPDALPAWYPAEDQDALLRGLSQALPTTRVVTWGDALKNPSPESPLYYRTDHHWTAAGARIAYEVLADFYGFALTEIAPQRYEAPDFYGAYYARAPDPWTPSEMFSVDLFANVTLQMDGVSMPGLLNEAQVTERDKYAAVLYGNHGAKTLLNPDAPQGTLLVLQDSYANALLPWLSQHFARIEAFDLRYFTGDLSRAIQETEADQILCIYGLSTLLTDRNLLLQSASWSSSPL